MPQTYSEMVSNVKTLMANADPEKLREDLGQTLSATKKVLDTFGSFLPGAAGISGALSFGAKLIGPQNKKSEADLQEVFMQVKKQQREVSKEIAIVGSKAKENNYLLIDIKYRVSVTNDFQYF